MSAFLPPARCAESPDVDHRDGGAVALHLFLVPVVEGRPHATGVWHMWFGGWGGDEGIWRRQTLFVTATSPTRIKPVSPGTNQVFFYGW